MIIKDHVVAYLVQSPHRPSMHIRFSHVDIDKKTDVFFEKELQCILDSPMVTLIRKRKNTEYKNEAGIILKNYIPTERVSLTIPNIV